MKTTLPASARCFLALATLVALITPVHAAVTNVVWYRLGENDPGAASGLAVTNTTADFVGTKHLKQFGSPTYTNAVSANAANRLGSSLVVSFNGNSQYLSNTLVSTAVNNFGIEAWVKPNTTNAGSYCIAYNGNTGANGWGIYQVGAGYSALFGNVVPFGVGFGAGTVVTGTWTHLALVRGSLTSTFFVNGMAAGTSASAPITPTLATGGFAVGARPSSPGEFFNGAIDEVRVFTFATGQFSTNDLLFNLQRVATLPASAITPINATLNGNVNPVGLPSSAWFEWGTTTNYGNLTPPQVFGSSTGNTNFNQPINGLSPGATYHYRAVASNSLGIVSGADQAFTGPMFNWVTNLTGVYRGSSAWGDYDKDGRLDIILAGATNDVNFTFGRSGYAVQMWRNTGSGFNNVTGSALNLEAEIASWADFDNDGDLDFHLTTIGAAYDTQLMVNRIFYGFSTFQNSNSFFIKFTGGPDFGDTLHPGRIAWGDYDNDGRLDLAGSGSVWRNTGAGFTFAFSVSGAVWAWGDYDNDGRADLVSNSGVYRNTDSGFTNINAGFPPFAGIRITGDFMQNVSGTPAWGDYDNDGRLDLVVLGNTNSSAGQPLSQVWRNTGSGFTNINAGLPGIWNGTAAWGDYDNDGRLDILLTGQTNMANTNGLGIAQVWRNTGTGFSNINVALSQVAYSSAAWGDYDNDGRLDILLTGSTNGNRTGAISQIWRNNTPQANTPPAPPTGLAVSVSGHTATFHWNASTDAQTPSSGLTYNLRVGTAPGASDILSPMSLNNGTRLLPQMGNVQHSRSWFLNGLAIGQTYYCSVQAVDSAFAGSAFAAEKTFTFNTTLTPTNGVPVVGDADGDGVVSQSEFTAVLANLNGNGTVSESNLNLVLSNYYANSPWLQMTNVGGLGGSNVTFALTNLLGGAFSVEYSTNLVDWQFLGPATPRYLFTDTNAPTVPQRYYRLRWP